MLVPRCRKMSQGMDLVEVKSWSVVTCFEPNQQCTNNQINNQIQYIWQYDTISNIHCDVWSILCPSYHDVNRMIPVPDISIGLLLEFVCVLFQRFNMALRSKAQSFPVALGSWANMALACNPLKWYGVILHCSPVESPFAPPMFGVIWFHRTRRMGTYWINANVHSPGLAIYAVHPSPAPDGRYGVGIPIALLTSQLAIGNCTKENVRNFELGWKVRIWLGEMKETKLIQR